MRLEGSANFKRGKEPGNWTQKQNGTPCDLLVNSEIRISAVFEIY